VANLTWLANNNLGQSARIFYAELYESWHGEMHSMNALVERAREREKTARMIYQRAGGEKFAAELAKATMRRELAESQHARTAELYKAAHGLYYRVVDPGYGKDEPTFTESWAQVDPALRAALVCGRPGPGSDHRRLRLQSELFEIWNQAKWEQRDKDRAAGLDTAWTHELSTVFPMSKRDAQRRERERAEKAVQS
jgi:hypothetical protein